jgi:hypothetical protein
MLPTWVLIVASATYGVCHIAFFADPDGNALMLHHSLRAAPHPTSDLDGQPAAVAATAQSGSGALHSRRPISAVSSVRFTGRSRAARGRASTTGSW